MELLHIVERHLRRHQITPNRFGKDAAGDPKRVFDLRRGRRVGPRLDARLRDYIGTGRKGPGACRAR